MITGDCEATEALRAHWEAVSTQDAYDEEAAERLRSYVGSVDDADFLECVADERLLAIMHRVGTSALLQMRCLARHGGLR